MSTIGTIIIDAFFAVTFVCATIGVIAVTWLGVNEAYQHLRRRRP